MTFRNEQLDAQSPLELSRRLSNLIRAICGNQNTEMSANEIEQIRLLVRHGADVNFKEGNGSLPLIAALAVGKESVVRLLLDLGANVNHPDGPLHRAAKSGRPNLVRLLLERGAYVNLIDSDYGRTPLHSATADQTMFNDE